MFKLVNNLKYLWNKFKGSREQFWDNLEEELILNNVSVETTGKILKEIKEHCYKNNINNIEEIKNLLKEKLKNILMEGSFEKLDTRKKKPYIILIA